MTGLSGWTLLGCDFTSAPSARKPITMARGRMEKGRVLVTDMVGYASFDAWQAELSALPPVPWVGGFDLPFGLPRELVTALGWPVEWRECMAHFASLDRERIRSTFAGFCNARPVGSKFAHRTTDGPAQASPSMKWVNPPVAFMLHAGVPRLIEAGLSLPGLLGGDPRRVALEAYPGMLARSVLNQASYKSDDKARQTPDRLIARRTLIEALESGRAPLLAHSGLRLKISHAQRDKLADDATGDTLDAVLCMLQVAWALQQHEAGHPSWGLPDFDPLEGWIVTA